MAVHTTTDIEQICWRKFFAASITKVYERKLILTPIRSALWWLALMAVIYGLAAYTQWRLEL